MDRTGFHRCVLETLLAGGVPTLIGGSHALAVHAGATRSQRDLDLMIRPDHWPWAEQTLQSAGIDCDLVFPHWLGKAKRADLVVDLIFSSGNGVATVDDDWFAYARPAHVLGMDVLVSPAEELLWSKAFVMERERFDGADVLHLLAAKAGSLDWWRVVRRFTGHEQVLLAHLMLFTYVYPGRAHLLPTWLVPELLRRAELTDLTSSADLCRGPLLSRAQYLTDLAEGGLVDGRRRPHGSMTDDDIDRWTRAIEDQDEPVAIEEAEPGELPRR
jgi:hypothetical protein